MAFRSVYSLVCRVYHRASRHDSLLRADRSDGFLYFGQYHSDSFCRTRESAAGIASALSGQHTGLFFARLSAGDDTCRRAGEAAQLYYIGFHSAYVDEFPAAHAGLADFTGEKRRH